MTYKLKLLILILLGIEGLSACAHVEQITTKDGKPLFEAYCRRSPADCHKLASEKCGGEYDVIDTKTTWDDIYMDFSCKK